METSGFAAGNCIAAAVGGGTTAAAVEPLGSVGLLALEVVDSFSSAVVADLKAFGQIAAAAGLV